MEHVDNAGYGTVRRVVDYEYRVVNSDGGIMFSASTADHSLWGAGERPADAAKRWLKTLKDYGHDVHIELWRRTYWVSESRLERLPYEPDEISHAVLNAAFGHPACGGCGRSWAVIEAGHGHAKDCQTKGSPPSSADAEMEAAEAEYMRTSRFKDPWPRDAEGKIVHPPMSGVTDE